MLEAKYIYGGIAGLDEIISTFRTATKVELTRESIFKMTIERVGILWFTMENYARAVAMSEDPMPKTYEEWHYKMEKTIRYLAPYVPIIKVEVEPEEHFHWCQKMGKKVDTKSRAAFASWYVSRDAMQ